MTIGEIIKNRRKQLGMSAEEIADIIGTSPATIYRYESNYITKMGIDKLTPIAKALRVSEAYLMGWTSDPNWRPDSDLSQPSSSVPAPELTEQEARLLGICRSLNEEGRERLAEYGDDLVASGKYIKRTSEYRPVSPIPEKQKAVEDVYKKVLGNVNAKEVEYDDI